MEGQELAERHIALRERAGLTQEQEAKIAGVSPTTISGIESGKITRPHLKTLLKIARALRADVGELRESGKVEAPSSQEKLFNNGVLEERREALEILFDNLRIHITGTADRWINAAETGLLFWSEDAAIAYSIEVNNEAAHLYGFVSEALEPALERLLAGTLTLRSEQRKLIEAVEHLNKAVEMANEAANAVAPPKEPTEEDWAAAIPILEQMWEEMDEVEQRRLLREVTEVLAAECEQAAEELRGRIA